LGLGAGGTSGDGGGLVLTRCAVEERDVGISDMCRS